MKYAKLLSPTSVSFAVPKSAKIDGKMVMGTLPKDYLNSIGFYEFVEVPMPEPEEGYHYELRYEQQFDIIVEVWTKVVNPEPPPAPVRCWTPLSIKRACKERWGALRDALQEADIYEDFIMAEELREDDEAFRRGYAWAVETYGQEVVDKVLDKAFKG